jgi:exopolysaccharide biosynthesis polyprenyl glycosylphosphotransferase
MFSGRHRKAKFLFGLSDILFTTLAFGAAYQSRIWLPFERVFALPLTVQVLLLGFSTLTWVALGIWLGVYERLDAGNPRVIVPDALRQALLGAGALVVFQYLLRLEHELSRSFLALFAVYSFGLSCAFRLMAGKLVCIIRREFGTRHYVMVAGTGESARRLGRTLEQSAAYGVRLIGFLAEDPATAPEQIELSAVYDVRPLAELGTLLHKRVIDEVIFAVDSHRLAGLEDTLLLCDEEGVRTRLVLDFFPHVNSDMYLDRLGSLPLLTFTATPHDEIRLFLKRSIDVVVSATALLVLAPLMAAVALLVRLTSPGPAIFKQVRCGLNGRRFMFYKFRSMCANAEALKAGLEHLNQKSTAFKIPNDPRLTPLGRYLRKFSVDEWPQLWNVFKGDMSLVGPRPAVPGEVDHYQGWQRRRLRMRPGLTCLWAVEGRDKLDFETWMKMDMHYIDHWSLALDWRILLLTIPRVLTGKGAY